MASSRDAFKSKVQTIHLRPSPGFENGNTLPTSTETPATFAPEDPKRANGRAAGADTEVGVSDLDRFNGTPLGDAILNAQAKASEHVNGRAPAAELLTEVDPSDLERLFDGTPLGNVMSNA